MLGGEAPFGVSSIVASEMNVAPYRASSGLVVAISQSGETADTITAMKRLSNAGYRTLAVTNVRHSSLARLADDVVYTLAGPEVAVAATKTFSTQIVIMALLAAKLLRGTERGRALHDALRHLPSRVQQTLERAGDLRVAGDALSKFSHMFVIGKGQTLPVTLEAALKVKELAYLHAEGVPAGQLKHGPFALLDESTPVLALVADDENKARMLTALREIKARNAPIYVLTDAPVRDVEDVSTLTVSLPKAEAGLGPVVFTVASQLLAYYCAYARGCPIDRPRNLAKSVTVP
jgi:glucosamine--fructose-6-phosphate aminotransferase (isomerizing)